MLGRRCSKPIALLRPDGESADLARALATLARQHMMLGEDDDAIDVGRQAMEMADRLGEEEIAIHAHDTLGSSMVSLGDDRGFEMLRQNLARCLAAGLDQSAARACFNLAASLNLAFLPRLAAPYAVQGIAIATAADLPLSLYGLLAEQADTTFREGRWGEALEQAQFILSHVSRSHLDRFWALVTVGQVRIRRGDPDPLGPVEEANELAKAFGFGREHQVGLISVEARLAGQRPFRGCLRIL